MGTIGFSHLSAKRRGNLGRSIWAYTPNPLRNVGATTLHTATETLAEVLQLAVIGDQIQ